MRTSHFKIILAGGLLTALLLFPVHGLRALGLGEARVDSYLGQALDVSVRLIEPESGSLDSLTVAPAEAADYDRLGIPTAALTLGLEVSVDRRADPPLIRLRSARQISDPVVQVLIDARWSSGRVLREYTLFLDPPTVPVAPPIRRIEQAVEPAQSAFESQTAQAPIAEQTVTEQESEPQSTTRPAPAVETTAPSEAVASSPAPVEPVREPFSASEPENVMRSSVIGPVASGQTLWGIASAWRTSNSLSMNQVMLAILDRNPQAFIDNNVNQLRRGAELSMPDSDQIAAISPAEADRRMRSQMQSWQSSAPRTRVPVIAEAAVPEVAVESDDEEQTGVDDSTYRLEVVPPEGETMDEGPAVAEEDVRAASQRLAELEDRMLTQGLESDELYGDVESIRQAIEARDMAGLAVADEEMAAFEARLRERREARAAERALAEAEATEADGAAEPASLDDVDDYFRQLEAELAAADEGGADADGESAVDSSLDDAMAADSTVSGAAEAEQEPEAVSETLPAPSVDRSQTVNRSSGAESGVGSWLWMALVGLLIIAGGALFWRLRGRSAGAGGSSARGAGLDPDAARERLMANRSDLDAHLGLLKALAVADDQEGFSDALDGMYAVVDDDEDPRWQEALNLAVSNAPNHPLLTPRETGFATDDADEGLDDRTREMLGILEQPERTDAARSVDDYEIDSSLDPDSEADGADDFFGEADSEDRRTRADQRREPEEQDAEATDVDLAQLSDRVDEDSGPVLDKPQVDDSPLDPDEEAPDFDEDVEVGDKALAEAREEVPADEDDLDLDFAFSSDTTESTERTSPGSERGDTLKLDPEELAAFESESAEDDSIESGRAGDTLKLDPDELESDDLGDRELEAFLREESDSDDLDVIDDEDMSADSGDLEDDEAEDDDGDYELSDDDADVKLDLARAYLSMDDAESARTLLEEIVAGGSSGKRRQAQELLDGI